MMKASIIKKMLTGALAVSLVMAPVMSVGATGTQSTGTGSGSTSSTVEEIIESSTSGGSEGGTVSTVAEVPTTSSVAGVKSTTRGIYLATSVKGSVITTSISAIAQGYGLTGSEVPYSKFSNLDPKKSNLAKQAIDMAAASQGAVVGPMLNIEIGKMSGGKYSLLPGEGAEIRIMLGIPGNFAKGGSTYAMVCVRAGGVVTILPDLDENPNTITFGTTGGAGAYAIIRY